MQNRSYYLSIVATTRNDNHGGDLLKRTCAFIQSVYHQSKKFDLPIELIIVEWNPPHDKPLLNEVLPKPDADTRVDLRIIVVPAQLHNRYRFADSLPLYQMIAKNVGIRRAKGEFVLCTNIDILFSDLNFEMLAARNLEKGKFYRANRCDIPKDVLKFTSHDEQLDYASQHIIRRLGNSPGHEAIKGPDIIYKYAWVATLLNKMLMWVWKKTHPGQFAHFTIDFMACGDYTLMSREDWLRIDGYAELDMYSIHVDSMGLWSACALGMQQVIFPYRACVYHIDHDNGWESDDIIQTIRFISDKPSLDYSIVHRAGMKMVADGKNWGLNKPDWGWANEDFDEYVFEGRV
ncbi:MAG: hypothetical protein GC178_03290 [Flavobacteriales bacterium]|nr:hypothetical protein [Flavobacteriales bacterium]